MNKKLLCFALAYLIILINPVLPNAFASSKKTAVDEYTKKIGDSKYLAARDVAMAAEIENTPLTGQFYVLRLEQLRDAGPECLPAIVAVLNRKIWAQNRSRIEDIIDAGLRDPATEIWYHIQWKNADIKKKIATAVMSVNPRAEIDLSPSVGYKKILKLGEQARPSVYRLLMGNINYLPNGINYRRAGSLEGGVLQSKVFAPSESEVSKILKRGGEYGKFVMMAYLAKEGKYSRVWLSTFSDWMSTKKIDRQEDLIAWLIASARLGNAPPDIAAKKIVKIILDATQRAVEKVVNGNPRPDDYHILPLAASLLVFYNDHDHLIRLKKLYKAFRQPLDRATVDDVLGDIDRYKFLHSNATSAERWIHKLSQEKGSGVE